MISRAKSLERRINDLVAQRRLKRVPLSNHFAEEAAALAWAFPLGDISDDQLVAAMIQRANQQPERYQVSEIKPVTVPDLSKIETREQLSALPATARLQWSNSGKPMPPSAAELQRQRDAAMKKSKP